MPPPPRLPQVAPFAIPFTLDLYQALVEQLPACLDPLPTAELSVANVAAVRYGRGIYQLFHRGHPCYFGKADNLMSRLNQHRMRCTGRIGLALADMTFRCLYLDKFVDAAAPETLLIRHYRALGQADWNQDIGFGPKDVGHERDTGRPGDWFLTYPPDHACALVLPSAGTTVDLTAFLGEARTVMPFLFRPASSRSRDAEDRASIGDFAGRTVTVPTTPQTPVDVLRLIVDVLPPGWQATVLPHAAILYREAVDYRHKIAGWRSSATGAVAL